MLKYTPEHMHCLATIHGALAPPNTGVLAIQTSTSNQQVTTLLLFMFMVWCWCFAGNQLGKGGEGLKRQAM